MPHSTRSGPSTTSRHRPRPVHPHSPTDVLGSGAAVGKGLSTTSHAAGRETARGWTSACYAMNLWASGPSSMEFSGYKIRRCRTLSSGVECYGPVSTAARTWCGDGDDEQERAQAGKRQRGHQATVLLQALRTHRGMITRCRERAAEGSLGWGGRGAHLGILVQQRPLETMRERSSGEILDTFSRRLYRQQGYRIIQGDGVRGFR
jgi:hypothetical protein